MDDLDHVDYLPILAGQTYAGKLARKRKRAILTGEQRRWADKERRKIKCNLLVISVAFVFLFTAFHGLQNLQTTVNGKQGMGPISLGLVYLSQALSSLALPSFAVDRLGCKQTLVVSMLIFTLYMLVQFAGPHWHALVPASLLLGAACACLWAAKCTYLAESGVNYAIVNVESPHVVIVRFFGVFFMFVHMGQVIGNVMSSVLLIEALGEVGTNMLMSNWRRGVVDKSCGHYFTGNESDLSQLALRNLKRPPKQAFLALVGAYVACTLAATLVIVCFLNSLRRDSAAQRVAPRCRLDVWRRTLAILARPKPLLLVPLTIFNGLEQAFIVGEFTKMRRFDFPLLSILQVFLRDATVHRPMWAYVGCSLGVTQIGLVMTAFGLADAICSLVFGPLIKLFSRMPLFMFGAVVDMLTVFTLLVWPPNPADVLLFYAVAISWGMADAVWNTQIQGFWVALVQGEHLEVAFANYRLWTSVGFSAALFYTPFTSTELKLYILLIILLLGMACYGLIEVWDVLTAYKEIYPTKTLGRMLELLPTRRRYVQQQQKSRGRG